MSEELIFFIGLATTMVIGVVAVWLIGKSQK
jgi:hypothetical protein